MSVYTNDYLYEKNSLVGLFDWQHAVYWFRGWSGNWTLGLGVYRVSIFANLNPDTKCKSNMYRVQKHHRDLKGNLNFHVSHDDASWELPSLFHTDTTVCFSESIEDTGEKGKCFMMLFKLKANWNFKRLQLLSAQSSLGPERRFCSLQCVQRQLTSKHYNQTQLGVCLQSASDIYLNTSLHPECRDELKETKTLSFIFSSVIWSPALHHYVRTNTCDA